ncbi:hypothetical protein GNI_113300 [Gregarina niphandrodes]|uniref:Uncharacterized protein n=1 Tax=Gregarina niphandrodes TaxID=110365 RepID=A0A023B3E5_GRENI|nr:hypothetical protein GNI_113300 [Gregarina niphandrodes]EZG55431.1 hypothetical protein GNI_113300 [Gregarina niphandrodes]|eukprot:XP_011131571.1 hypothetical protein GNI_113300 [Gregarina niphandrodes]
MQAIAATKTSSRNLSKRFIVPMVAASSEAQSTESAQASKEALAEVGSKTQGKSDETSWDSDKLMSMMKEVEEKKKEVMKQFSSFQTGDKDSYSHDEKSQTAIRNAVASSQGAGVMRVEYLQSAYTLRCLGQTESVMTKTILPALGVKPFDGSTTVAWNDLPLLHQRLSNPQTKEAALKDIRERTALSRGSPISQNPGSFNTKTGALSAGKVFRTALLRAAFQDINFAKQIVQHQSENVLEDDQLRRLLDLRADAWTDLAVTW